MDDADLESLTEAERRFLGALNTSGVRYLLVGMSAALLQGARGATDDVDLWFESIADARIGDAARTAGGCWVTRAQPPPPRLGGAIGERFDVVTDMPGLPDFAVEYARAIDEVVGGVPVKLLPLSRIIVSKRAAGRPKDDAVVHALEAALEVIEALKRPRP